MSFRLDAINRCLAAIGESPVNTPADPIPDAQAANKLVDEITKSVLAAGWNCNTAYNIKKLPDDSGEIAIGTNVISADTTGYSSSLAVSVMVDENDERTKLFQIKDQTFIFTDPVYLDIVYNYDVDSLPWHLQNYIGDKAARVFQERQLGSSTVDTMLTRNEAASWTQVVDKEAELEDSNCLVDSAYMRYVTGRNNRVL